MYSRVLAHWAHSGSYYMLKKMRLPMRSEVLRTRSKNTQRGAVPSGGMARPPLAGQGDAATLGALMARDAA